MRERPEIDYDFRPAGFWDDDATLQLLLRGATSAADRTAIVAYWEAGRLDLLPHTLAQTLDCDAVGEREIARFEAAPGRSDALSVRARPIPHGIRYRLVDDRDPAFAPTRESNGTPWTLRELITFIDSGARIGEVAGFAAVRSDLYPQLAQHYAHWVLPEPSGS
jgi:hypothetical protein